MLTGRRKEKFVAEIQSGSHTLIADVEEKLGGTDLGPGPHELLKISLAALVSVFLFITSACTQFPEKSTGPVVVPWQSEESIKRLAHAEKRSFLLLTNQFESQENKFFCGPTSAVIVLNALRSQNPKIKKPLDPALYRGPDTPILKMINPVFERYTQDAFFNSQTDKIKTRDQVFGVPVQQNPVVRDGGIQLRQLGEMLKIYNVEVSIQVVGDSARLEELKKDLLENLQKPGHFVLVNFQRQALGQTRGAHISPLGAYDSSTDSVLIMDVNTTDHTWVWVSVDTLIEAMRTKDTFENRGYLVISEKI